MKKKPLLILCVSLALAGVLLLGSALLLGGFVLLRSESSYARALDANWGVRMPFKALFREEYRQDTGPSFHGDGTRYHVFSYRYEDYVDLMFAWGSGERETLFHDSLIAATEEWLDEMNVPAEYRPDTENCWHWYTSKHDNSELILYWDAEANLLYILQHIL